jgi:hypothetical protein
MEAQLDERFASFYPQLDPRRWYPVSPRGVDTTRPEGATRSAGGPTPSEGVWIEVEGEERFIFRHHVRLRPAV